MRNPKFRIWDQVEKKWLVGYETMGGFSLMGETMLLGGLDEIKLEKLSNGDYIIMQWTYILDSKNHPIYEGDIVRQVTVDPGGKTGSAVNYVVIYDRGSFWIENREGEKFLLYFNREDLTVIGNIHQHKVLME